jgi:hypothetical protein
MSSLENKISENVVKTNGGVGSDSTHGCTPILRDRCPHTALQNCVVPRPNFQNSRGAVPMHRVPCATTGRAAPLPNGMNSRLLSFAGVCIWWLRVKTGPRRNARFRPMSASGSFASLRLAARLRRMSAMPSKRPNLCVAVIRRFGTNSGLMHRNKGRARIAMVHSITSSARARKSGGMSPVSRRGDKGAALNAETRTSCSTPV